LIHFYKRVISDHPLMMVILKILIVR